MLKEIDNKMKLFSNLFFVISTVVGTISVAAEPCDGKYGKYDMPACDECAENGKGRGQCCNAIYHNSLGRDDDEAFQVGDDFECGVLNQICDKGKGSCLPGLFGDNVNAIGCQLKTNDPNAHMPSSLLTSSSSTGTTTNGRHSFVLVVVGLLVAAMMVLKMIVQHRHRGLLRRHQYSEVDATRIDV